MPTIQQLIRHKRQSLENKTKSPALIRCPQRRGVCTRVYVRFVRNKIEDDFKVVVYNQYTHYQLSLA